MASDCLQILPATASKVGPPQICQSDFSGTQQNYACQDYCSDQRCYRVLYKGGLIPKAILQLDSNRKFESVMLTEKDIKLSCPLSAPADIPLQAKHLGTGVCNDEQDTLVPCSLYEYAPARQAMAYRYMVFFTKYANGICETQIDTQHINNLQNAMTAELAYQFGISLKDTGCCTIKAINYLEYAYQLFPGDCIYRDAYLQILSTSPEPTPKK